MKAIIRAFARNTVFSNILLILILAGGGIAAFEMIRETFPQMSLDLISIQVAYPGADPEEVEEGISRKLEEVLEGMEGIKQYDTTSCENVAFALIEVLESYDIKDVLDRIRSNVDSISTFPVDAEQPIITELKVRNPVMTLALSGAASERSLKEWAERAKDELQQHPDVSQVDVSGVRDYEINIELSEECLQQYGLSLPQVAGAIRQSSLNLAGGTLRTQGEQIRIRTMGRKYWGKDFADIVIITRPEGENITLGQLATIRDGFTEDPIITRANGKPAVFLTIFKTEMEDSIKISNAVQAYIDRKNIELPESAQIGIVYDDSIELRARINLLVRNGLIGVSLVFLLLWIFLDLRLSFWAGMGMPISVAGALAISWMLGATLNMISLFGLIMVLGIIVDDAIVVGEAIYVHRQEGKGPLDAAVDGVCEVGVPVIAAVTTTIVAFLPLAYMGGIMGKFIAILPVVVIACLGISLVECLIILPSHLSHLPDPNRERSPWQRRINAFHSLSSRGLMWFVNGIYSRFLEKSLKWRYVVLCAALTVLMLTVGLQRGGILKFEVFPDLDGFMMIGTVEYPEGTPPEVTERAVRKMEAAALRVAETHQTLSGAPLIKQNLSMVGGTLEPIPSFGPNYGSVQVIMADSEDRGIHATKLMVAWKDQIGVLTGAESLSVHGMEHGPPGAPIEIWLQGPEMDRLLTAAEELKKRLSQFNGVYQIQSDFRQGKNEMRLTLKPEARALGLTVDDLARQVHAGFYGQEVVRLQRGRDDIRVKVRYTADERSRLAAVEQVRIRTQTGQELPLHSVAEIDFAPGYAAIKRTNGMRKVAVTAEIETDKANANEIFDTLSDGYFQMLMKKYPDIYVSPQGEKKKMRESIGSLKIGFPLALLGIFIIIATIFRSYLQPLVIMATVPFGVIGAFLGHLLLGFDLSIMSIFGMVALAGVVVNDAIVLIEAINNNLSNGMPFYQAIREGGVRRFRAVFLTTISTVGGLTPMIVEKDFQAQFLIPMALSIAAGVAFATVLTLVLIPSLLVILNDIRCLWHYTRHAQWPAREEVEPARNRRETPTQSQHRTHP